MSLARRTAPAAALLLATLAASTAAAQQPQPTPLLIRPERTEFRETSRYADVVAFLGEADRRSPLIHLTAFGYSNEGRALPLAVVGHVTAPTPAAVRAAGRTRVLLLANIHAGEVEGKEALQTLLREVAEGQHGALLDSLVLLVAPIYNADGNERVALGNRPHQLGPVGGMGQRPNAQGLDLNRDQVKLDSPEARSLARMLTDYDPHVVVDLHTTNGTYHGYHLTYAPPLHPGTDAAIDRLLRGRWLPAVTAGMRARHGFHVYHYGNVPDPESRWAAAEGAKRGWYSFDHRPRFVTNYVGLRNRVGILSEAYAYLPFDQRILVTRRFVDEILGWARDHAGEVRAATRAAECSPVVGTRLPLSARHRRGERPATILMGAVDTLRHPFTGEPMMRRRDAVRAETMPEWIAFEATESEVAPAAYLVPAALGVVADRLEAHGIRFRRLEAPAAVRAEEFRIDSTTVAERPFQGRRERQLWGRWVMAERTVPAGTLEVPLDQPLGRLAFTLLEPRSDDGLAGWNLLDEALREARAYPVLRVARPLPGSARGGC